MGRMICWCPAVWGPTTIRRPSRSTFSTDPARRTNGAGSVRLARPFAVVVPGMLRLQLISKAFPGVQALSRVDFDVLAGEIHALVGENGAGKSTLTKIIAGVYQPDEGQIEFNNAPVRWNSPGE